MIKNNTVAFSCLKDECQEGIKGSSMYCVKGESEKTLFGSEP